jgi:MFS family permease
MAEEENDPDDNAVAVQPLLISSEILAVAYTNRRPVSSEGKNIVFYSCCNFPGRRRQRRVLQLNHNVFLNLILMVTYGIGEGLWGGAVFAAYLKQLYHGKNSEFEAVYSIAELAFAIPIGYLADHLGRAKIIRVGAILFLFTAIFHFATTYWLDTHRDTNTTTTILLMIIMGLWGVGAGVVAGPCEALFADSTLPGSERDKWYGPGTTFIAGHFSSSRSG